MTAIPGESELERLVNRSRLIGSDPAARAPRRRQHLDEARSSATSSAASGGCCGSRAAAPTSRRQRGGLPGALARRAAAAPRARRDERRGDGRLPGALARRPRRAGDLRSRRSCMPSCPPRTSITSTPTRSARSRTRPTRTRRCARHSAPTSRSSTTSARASSSPAASPSSPAARAVVLAHHGLVTWGETHEESYGLTLELVGKAQDAVGGRDARGRRRRSPTRAPSRRFSSGCAGASRASTRQVLATDRGAGRARRSPDVERLAELRGTPDHMLRIGDRAPASSGSTTTRRADRRVRSGGDGAVRAHRRRRRAAAAAEPGAARVSRPRVSAASRPAPIAAPRAMRAEIAGAFPRDGRRRRSTASGLRAGSTSARSTSSSTGRSSSTS